LSTFLAVGALFSSTPAEFGTHAVIDRYSLLQPKVLFTIDSYRYGGKTHQVTERAKTVVKALVDAGKLDHVVVIGHLAKDREPAASSLTGHVAGPTVRSWSKFMELGNDRPETIPFFRGDFNHPIWIVFSSGTTGKPKSIVSATRRRASGTMSFHIS
jgi:acetoacetyl-CoA synthetase